jgi:hypothetical protein
MAFTPSIFAKLTFNEECLRKFSKFLEKYENYGWQAVHGYYCAELLPKLILYGNSNIYAPVLKVMEIW